MSEQKKRGSMSEAGDPNPLETGERRAVDRLEDPTALPGGSASGENLAKPRDREAADGTTGVVPGFTGTGPSGTQSGRSLYGIAPDDDINPEGE